MSQSGTSNQDTRTAKLVSGILGFAVGDALGVPVEFKPRAELAANPVTGMRAHGSHNQPAGTWSDDTSMVLATLDSLASDMEAQHPVDHQDYAGLMQRFTDWFDHGAFTPYGQAFDFGSTTARAIGHFKAGIPPLDCGCTGEFDNGNGSLMRILPIVFYLEHYFGTDFEKRKDHHQNRDAFTIIHNISALTHAHPRSQLACGLYCCIAAKLLGDLPLPIAINAGLITAMEYYNSRRLFANELQHYHRLFAKNFPTLHEKSIKSSGYVVDTLEAALWCLLTTTSYRDCVLKAVNLGEDTDTIAAVAGGLAGMHYGVEAIPAEWRATLVKQDYILGLCARFTQASE
jgi:ADP-ribosyl-[dinitrogen reductase] hydrolase